MAAAILSTPPARADAPKWGAHLDFEGRWGEGRSLGDVGLFAPLWQNAATLFFTDLRFKYDNDDSREGNFGLGLRHMLANGWNVGAYGYFDRRRSGSGQYFNQATFGLEALSADWDLRANAYLPFGERTKSLGVSGGGAPFAELANGTIEVVTPGVSERLERALTGFDGEVGWRLPVFSAESLAQLRAYAGGYWFDGGGLIDDITGPRGRMELSFDDPLGLRGARFTLGGELQHDDLRGTQAYASARLRIPLQAPDRAAPRLTAQEARMTERVVRDVDVVTGEHGKVIDVREAAINTTNNQTVTAATQVDAASGQAALQTALTAHGNGGVVILNGALTGLTASTNLSAQGTLIGGGTALPVRGATSGTQVTFIAPGAAGTLGGPVAGAVVTLATGSVVGGLTIENTNSGSESRGILGNAAAGATVFGNRIKTGSGDAIAFFNASHEAAAIGNFTEMISGRAIHFAGSNNGKAIGNNISGGGTGISFINSDNGTANGNVIADVSYGVEASSSTGITVSGNAFGTATSVIHTEGATSGFTAGSTGNTWTGQGGALCNLLVAPTGSVQFTDAGFGAPGSCP